MNLIVQVAFDLEDCKKSEYDAVESWLASVGLRRNVQGNDGVEIRLPANTFVGYRNCYSSPQEAIAHIQEQLKLAAMWDFCTGKAFITVSLAEMTTHDQHAFGL